MIRDFLDRTPSPSPGPESVYYADLDATTISASPIDEDNERQFKIEAERKDREYLISEGCPPCHPLELTPSYDADAGGFDNYPAALYYSTGESTYVNKMPILAQAGDWRGFRQHQKRGRSALGCSTDPQLGLASMMGDARVILRKHGFSDAAKSISGWVLDAKTQGKAQNLIELHVWHLRRYEAQKAGIQKRINNEGSKELRQWRQKFEERSLQLHKGLIQWIDEQRKAMMLNTSVAKRRDVARKKRTAAVKRSGGVHRTNKDRTADIVITRYGRQVRKPERYVPV